MLFQQNNGQQKKIWVKQDLYLGFVFNPEEKRAMGEASFGLCAGLHPQRRKKNGHFMSEQYSFIWGCTFFIAPNEIKKRKKKDLDLFCGKAFELQKSRFFPLKMTIRFQQLTEG